MTASELVKAILDELAKEHGLETFVSDGYGYYEDAHEKFTELLAKTIAENLRERGPG